MFPGMGGGDGDGDGDGDGCDCDCVDENCCACWKEGCGLDKCCGVVANGLEAVNPAMEYFADCIWLLGSPLAFPIVFCFPAPSPDETVPPGGGWSLSMLNAPLRRPLHCCLYTACAPCGQWQLRRQALEYDMTRYKLWQGQHDGPHCCATRCGPSAPCTIRSGTYGESDCPHIFLGLEVCCLAGVWSTCCSFNVTRRLVKDDRNLGQDPTEVRVNNCIGFFSKLAQQCCLLGLCVGCSACLIGCCAPDSDGAQECSGEAGRASSACRSCARTCWRGIWSVKIIAVGCMSTQMDYEMVCGAQPLPAKPAPANMTMEDRGGGAGAGAGGGATTSDEDDSWWKKPPPGK
jgi:hypothetical protein